MTDRLRSERFTKYALYDAFYCDVDLGHSTHLDHPSERSGMHRSQYAAVAFWSSKAKLSALQSSSEGSRRLYERLGYHVRETVFMDKGAPPLYLMSRPTNNAGHAVDAVGQGAGASSLAVHKT